MIGECKGLFDACLMMGVMVVKILLPRAEFACNDVADALALCHRVHRGSFSHRLRVTA